MKVTVRACSEVHAAEVETGLNVARLYDAAGDDHLEVVGDVARVYRRTGLELDQLVEIGTYP